MQFRGRLVTIAPDDPTDTKVGGVMLPDQVKTGPVYRTGRVLALPQPFDEEDENALKGLRVGMRVVYNDANRRQGPGAVHESKHSVAFSMGGQEQRVFLPAHNIIATLEEDEQIAILG